MDTSQPTNLIEQLDCRQNAMLTELDELNRRIEFVIGKWQHQDVAVGDSDRVAEPSIASV